MICQSQSNHRNKKLQTQNPSTEQQDKDKPASSSAEHQLLTHSRRQQETKHQKKASSYTKHHAGTGPVDTWQSTVKLTSKSKENRLKDIVYNFQNLYVSKYLELSSEVARQWTGVNAVACIPHENTLHTISRRDHPDFTRHYLTQ